MPDARSGVLFPVFWCRIYSVHATVRPFSGFAKASVVARLGLPWVSTFGRALLIFATLFPVLVMRKGDLRGTLRASVALETH